MDASEAASRQVGGDDAITTRIGAVAPPIAVVLIAISEVFHPSGEDPMDFPAVFREYAQSDEWTTVHFGEYFRFLFLLGGLVALYYSVSARPGLGAGLVPFGLAAAVTTASSFTVLQAVDGVTLRYAVHNWVSAPDPQKTAAEVARWTEIGMNGFSYFLMQQSPCPSSNNRSPKTTPAKLRRPSPATGCMCPSSRRCGCALWMGAP
jgi:hypothetical protein